MLGERMCDAKMCTTMQRRTQSSGMEGGEGRGKRGRSGVQGTSRPHGHAVLGELCRADRGELSPQRAHSCDAASSGTARGNFRRRGASEGDLPSVSLCAEASLVTAKSSPLRTVFTGYNA